MNKYEKLNFLLSILAIFISSLTVYFQFFFHSHEIRLSIIETEIKYPIIQAKSISSFETKLFYHNNGNQFCTILLSEFKLHQKEKYLTLYNYQTQHEPTVLMPGEQKIVSLQQKFEFYKIEHIDLNKPVNIEINVDFINGEGQRSNEIVPVGWIKLNSKGVIEKFEFKYPSKILEGNRIYALSSGDIQETIETDTATILKRVK